ncbi:MAG TPA: class I SAM-dependent methyltransferase [Gemmatimonadaceae bacterium]|nr:class I SAM-dependent methyltransferase [Gemmatimonadaceae bacterium]
MSHLRTTAWGRHAYDRAARDYDARHGEIFNEIEQARLAGAVREALAAVRDAPVDAPVVVASDARGREVRALDVGAGTGNLTRQLLACGARVTAADVSPVCLALVHVRFPDRERVALALLDGKGLGGFGDGTFDLSACYSVLHHVPDYLALVREMARIVRPGGVVYLDHERHDASWAPSPERDAFLREAVVWPARTWRRFLRPAAWWRRVRPMLAWRRWLNPRWMPEGDLHIWPDDHIEWPEVEAALAGCGVRKVVERDYLLYEPRYARDVWERWKDRVTDYRMWIGRKA